MYKLSAYYHAHAKQELPYYGVEKTSEEIHNILVNTHLNPDEDLIEFMDDNDNTEIESVFDEEDSLKISDVLNLDAEEFIKNLDEIIEDSLENDNNIQNISEPEVTSDIEWDPTTEINSIINDI
jgi:hypothetical protein